mmetsp:Transcript_115543/g.172640  ORF Transcript_115543/g.172640 Transcript_115543/m.172640 type:complete len:207 (-) Transcript_115543:310-930(-)
MEEAKKCFEAEKEKTMQEIPEKQRNMFGAIGFCRVEEEDDDDDDDDEDEEEQGESGANDSTAILFEPVLIVSPFDVPPKPIRDIYWMERFSKAKRSKKKLAEMDYLVYLYGSDDPDDCYNFCKQEDFITFDEAKKQGWDQLSTALQAKVDAGAKLSETEERLIRGLKEMEEDALKDPQDRKHGAPFLEKYQQAAAAGPAKKKRKTG